MALSLTHLSRYDALSFSKRIANASVPFLAQGEEKQTVMSLGGSASVRRPRPRVGDGARAAGNGRDAREGELSPLRTRSFIDCQDGGVTGRLVPVGPPRFHWKAAEKSGPRPSAIVGCARMASRKPV